MPLPKLKTCCCCFTLETGVKIVGYLQAIFGFLFALLVLLAWCGLLGAIAASPTNEDANKDHPDGTAIAVAATIVMAIFFIACIISGLLGVFLLLGVYKRIPSYIKVCLIVGVIGLIMQGISFIMSVVDLFNGNGEGEKLIGLVFYLVFESYILLVIYSFYLELREGNVNTF